MLNLAFLSVSLPDVRPMLFDRTSSMPSHATLNPKMRGRSRPRRYPALALFLFIDIKNRPRLSIGVTQLITIKFGVAPSSLTVERTHTGFGYNNRDDKCRSTLWTPISVNCDILLMHKNNPLNAKCSKKRSFKSKYAFFPATRCARCSLDDGVGGC